MLLINPTLLHLPFVWVYRLGLMGGRGVWGKGDNAASGIVGGACPLAKTSNERATLISRIAICRLIVDHCGSGVPLLDASRVDLVIVHVAATQ